MDAEKSPLTSGSENGKYNWPKILAIASIVAAGLACVTTSILFTSGIFIIFLPYMLITVSLILAVIVLRIEKEGKTIRVLAIVGIVLCVISFVITLIAIIIYAVTTQPVSPKNCAAFCQTDADCKIQPCIKCVLTTQGQFCTS